jgi:hypothetical protein
MARDFCIENGIIRRFQTSPVVDIRRIAALLWLTLGSPEDRAELSKRQLLLNCAAAIRSRPDILRKMIDTLKRTSPEKLPQLQAVLTLPRSSQLLADATLNDEELINGENIERVLEVVRSAAVETEKRRYQEALESAEHKARDENLALEAKLIQLQQDVSRERGEVGGEIERLKEELKRIIEEEENQKVAADYAIRVVVTSVATEIAKTRSRMITLLKLTLSGLLVPSLTYAAFVTSSVIHTTLTVTFVSATAMALVSCSCVVSLWRSNLGGITQLSKRRVDQYYQGKFAGRILRMSLDPKFSRLFVNWATGTVSWGENSPYDDL